MTPRPTHYIDLAAYRRLGRPVRPSGEPLAAPQRVDWLTVCTWTLALALSLSFYAFLWLLVSR